MTGLLALEAADAGGGGSPATPIFSAPRRSTPCAIPRPGISRIARVARFTRAGSVGMVRIFLATDSGSSAQGKCCCRRISDIFWPSSRHARRFGQQHFGLDQDLLAPPSSQRRGARRSRAKGFAARRAAPGAFDTPGRRPPAGTWCASSLSRRAFLCPFSSPPPWPLSSYPALCAIQVVGSGAPPRAVELDVRQPGPRPPARTWRGRIRMSAADCSGIAEEP